jgi:hypothetical protein
MTMAERRPSVKQRRGAQTAANFIRGGEEDRFLLEWYAHPVEKFMMHESRASYFRHKREDAILDVFTAEELIFKHFH